MQELCDGAEQVKRSLDDFIFYQKKKEEFG